MMSFGLPVARHGDKTACGAVLLASQVVSTWDGGSLDVGIPQPLTPLPAGVSPQTPTLCLECLLSAAQRGSALVARG